MKQNSLLSTLNTQASKLMPEARASEPESQRLLARLRVVFVYCNFKMRKPGFKPQWLSAKMRREYELAWEKPECHRSKSQCLC